MQQVDPPRPGMRGRVATVAVIAVMVLSGIALVGAALIHPGAAVAPPKEASGLPASPSAASHASPYVASGAVSPLTFTPSWWQLPKVPAQLSSRCCVAFAYDPVWGGDILFGGNTGAAQKDTWLFNNSQWTSLTSSLSTAPSARWGAVMVWDAYDNYLVLFGGRSPTSFFSDTWIFNATGWHALTPSSAPSARAFTQAFYDPTLHEVVLFGGSNEVSTKPVTWADYGDTWTFQSGTWTNITSSLSVSPPKTASAYMDWDPTDSVGIMFGGTATSAGCANYNTTWAFGSSGWTNITSAVTGDPGYYENGAGVWDGIDHYLVAFGGIEPTGSGTTCTKPMAESWEYTTDVWTNQTAAMGSNIPKARSSMEMTYDPLLKTVIMFGGDTTGKGNFVNEVWSYPVAPIVPTITVVNTVIPINTAINYNLTMTGGAGPFTFTWTFDDGSSSVATENTTHTFTNLGTYTVNVEIQDAQSRYANATVQMTVVAHLSAAATTSSVAGEKPFKVTFNATYNGGVPPFTWGWHFGDGANSGNMNTTHVYNSVGNFTAYFNISDSATEYVNISHTIAVYGPLAATIGPASPVGAAPVALSFSGNASMGLAPFTYSWSWGDNTTNSTGQYPTHTYTTAGAYSVKVTVTDALGYTASATTTATIYPGLSYAAVPSASSGLPPLPVTFTAAAVGGTGGGVPPDSYSWDFGDGSATASGTVVSHTFSTEGLYTVTLTVTDSVGDIFTNTTTIAVSEPLTISSATASATSGPVPLDVNFTAVVSGGVAPLTYTWAFSDGGTGSGLVVSHTFHTVGAQTATFTVTDPAGETPFKKITIFTYEALTASVSATPREFYLGNATTLTAIAHYGNGSYSYDWTGLPGGCTSSNRSTLNCLPTEAGTFNVTVSVFDAALEEFNATVTLTVEKSSTVAPNHPTNSTGSSFPVAYALLGVAAILAIAVVALLLLRRRPPAGEEEPGAEDGAGGGGGGMIYGATPPGGDETDDMAPTAAPPMAQYTYGETPKTGDEEEEE